MNEKTARQIEAMKAQTIGVEVEMNSITREKAAKLAAGFFGTGRYQDTARRNGYSTWSAWDTDGREWKFQKDVSIAGPDAEKCELVTPILTYTGCRTGRRRTVSAFVYVMREDRPLGVPSAGYMRTCLEGYDAFRFDRDALLGAYFKSREVCGDEG